MNRNVESHFALNPTNIDIRRSTFDRSHSLKTSFNVGDIVPFFMIRSLAIRKRGLTTVISRPV